MAEATCNHFVSQPHPEMNEFEFQVDFYHTLGKGRFGTVYMGYDDRNRRVAVKKVDAEGAHLSEADEEDARREATQHEVVRSRVRHPNLVTVHAVHTLVSAIYIVMELCNLGNLNEYFLLHPALCSTSITSVRTILHMARDMISGLAYLHDSRLAHRDIKPDNILLTQSSPGGAIVAKLGDYGLMKELDADPRASSEMNSDVGSPYFKSPEFFEHCVRVGVQYGRKADVYSLALVFLSMIQARPGRPLIPADEGLQPSDAENPIIIAKEALCRANNAANGLQELIILRDDANDSKLLMEIKQIIRDMLQVYPEDRLSSAEAQRKIEDLIGVCTLFILHKTKYSNTCQTGMPLYTVENARYFHLS